MTTAYLIGSYPWVQNPADTDLLIIVEGEFDWTPFTSRDLQARGVWVPELSADLALEIVGSETLLLAKAGEQVVDAERVALRHTLLYGSVLLAGRDIFESSSIRIEDLDHLRNDLLRDRKEADWPVAGVTPANTPEKVGVHPLGLGQLVDGYALKSRGSTRICLGLLSLGEISRRRETLCWTEAIAGKKLLELIGVAFLAAPETVEKGLGFIH